MAMNDNATLVIGAGNYFTAPVGTEAPVDLSAPDSAWTNVGHTSLEDILSIASEGGEVSILGTLQNKQLRTIRSARSDSFSIILQQFDSEALKLYHGANSPVVAGGMIGNPVTPQPTQRAFLAVYVDGNNIFAIYCPKADILRGGEIEFADTESYAGLPLSITPLAYQTNNWTYAVTPIGDTASAPAWQATTAYSLGDFVTLSDSSVLECTTAGTSDSTEPTAPGVGLTVTDGTVEWTQVS